MQIITDYANCPEKLKESFLALGNFDGVHKGHKAIIQKAVEKAKESGGLSAVMTFEPHPRQFFQTNSDSFRITPFTQKAKLIEKLGVDILFVVDFNQEFAKTNASDFIENILHKSLSVKYISIGYDFAFGNKKQGNYDLLKEKSSEFGYEVHQTDAVTNENIIISSTEIRKRIESGKIDEISQISGQNFCIAGKVIKGFARGREIGFPTANISLGEYIKPKFGVYAVKVHLEGKKYNAVANIGVKPTIKGKHQPLLEVYIFDFKCDIYDKELEVELIKFIRDEQKFDSLEQLKQQIADDCDTAKNILTN